MAAPLAAVGAAAVKAKKIKAIVDQVWETFGPILKPLLIVWLAFLLLPIVTILMAIHLLLNPESACDADPNGPGGANATTSVKVADMSRTQLNVAASIIATGQRLGVPDRGILIALMTAMQESTMNPTLNEGQSDRDSVGLFQQRRAWSSNPTNNPATDPRFDAGKAAEMFFKGGAGGQQGLLDKAWQLMNLGSAAQAVQVSAFPGAYAKWQDEAEELLAKLKGNITPSTPSTPGTPGTGTSADAAIGLMPVGSCDPTGLGAGEPGNGGLIAPLANARETSPFGRRFHPILRYWKLHTGQDFGAAEGTPIKAAASGKVVSRGYAGGNGNYTCIQHTTPNVKTCYAHQSKYNVTNGQTVNQGDVIGYVGDTGFSTNPHLHFEVYVDGKPVDPMKWIGKAPAASGSKLA